MVQVAVLGAGPTGLEAALAAVERGWDVTVYEAAPAGRRRTSARGATCGCSRPGRWTSRRAPRRRSACPRAATARPARSTPRTWTGWPRCCPTCGCGPACCRSPATGLLKHEEIGTDERGARPLPPARRGARTAVERLEHADVVLDCTGTYGSPNPTGARRHPRARRAGARAPRRAGDPARRRVVGRPPGARSSVRATARRRRRATWSPPGRELVWAVRRDAPTWGAVEDDVLPDRAALVASSDAGRRRRRAGRGGGDRRRRRRAVRARRRRRRGGCATGAAHPRGRPSTSWCPRPAPSATPS